MAPEPVIEALAQAAIEEEFEAFDVTVSLGPDGLPWLSAQSSAGFVHGIPRRDARLPTLDDLLDLVYDYADAVAFAEPDSHPELAAHLNTLVFGDPMVVQLFQATRGIAADRRRKVLFRILASPHLAALPWELLPDPSAPPSKEPQRYLTLAPDVQIVRQARGRSYSSRPRTVLPPINLLLVLSSPRFPADQEGRYEFDVFEVKRNLVAELAPLVRAGFLEVDVEDRPTIDSLRRRIASRKRGYHVFHYVGHALPDRLILEDSGGRAQEVDSNRLVELLRLCPDLRLAVFAGCETARPKDDPLALNKSSAAGWRDLLSLADRCVQGACPIVIGMQAVLPLTTERVFTRYLYQGLASGYSIADALRIARGAVHGDHRYGGLLLDWSVPVLFVGGENPGPLLPRGSVGTPPPERQRIELRLGIRGSSERFLARDLALRQVVDILAGNARERVIVITGPAGAGKTTLVDRALEELSGEEGLVLFMHARTIAPLLNRACEAIETLAGPDIGELLALSADCVVQQLCRRVAELLARAGHRSVKEDDWTALEWWERLVGDLGRHRCVLALDEVAQVDQLQATFLRAAAGLWLRDMLEVHPQRDDQAALAENLEQLLVRMQLRLERHEEGLNPTRDGLGRGLEQLSSALDGLPARLQPRVTEAFGHALVDAISPAEAGDALAGVSATSGSPGRLRRHFERRLEQLAMQQAGTTHLRTVLLALQNLELVREQCVTALQMLIDRRGAVRTALVSNNSLRGFLDIDDDIFELRLAHLTWSDSWRWIRRSLPGLLRYGESFLSRVWMKLGARAELWEELERRVVRQTDAAFDLEQAVNDIAPPTRSAGQATRVTSRWRRGERPLRIAVAGPHLVGPAQTAAALTQIAINHGVAGRVVSDGIAEGALAMIVGEPMPFSPSGVVSMQEVNEWLQRLVHSRPDVVLLDYGQEIPLDDLESRAVDDPEWHLLRSMNHRSLLIGAGGNEGRRAKTISVPGAYSSVLQVGAAAPDGLPRNFASWSATHHKPDLFMEDDLTNTPLATAVSREHYEGNLSGPWGSSFAALHAVSAAVLAWSLLPHLTPLGVRRLLEDAAKPVGVAGQRFLTVGAAVALARTRLVQRSLRSGPCTLATLSAITGLDPDTLMNAIRAMGRSVIHNKAGRLERYELA